jgi:NADPH:quinone reductase-like Zn-dependent oxidoreductase
MTDPTPMTKVLIFGGKTGWIGQMMYQLCKEQGKYIIACKHKNSKLKKMIDLWRWARWNMYSYSIV